MNESWETQHELAYFDSRQVHQIFVNRFDFYIFFFLMYKTQEKFVDSTFLFRALSLLSYNSILKKTNKFVRKCMYVCVYVKESWRQTREKKKKYFFLSLEIKWKLFFYNRVCFLFYFSLCFSCEHCTKKKNKNFLYIFMLNNFDKK